MTVLRPRPRLGLRLAAFAGLAVFAVIGSASWTSKLGFCAGMAFLFGSYRVARLNDGRRERRSEEHTSELQSRRDLVCRLLLEKKKQTNRCRCPEALPDVHTWMPKAADACAPLR